MTKNDDKGIEVHDNGNQQQKGWNTTVNEKGWMEAYDDRKRQQKGGNTPTTLNERSRAETEE
jgi:hypothetical protein